MRCWQNSRTNAPPVTVSVYSAAVMMPLVAADTVASALQAAVGDRVARIAAGGCWRSACHRAGSGRTRAHAATKGAPRRKIVWPMCSRLSLECEEPRITVAVKKVAHLQATRQTSGDQSQAHARTACAMSAPTYLARLTSIRERTALSRVQRLEHGQWPAAKGLENPP